MRPLRPLRKDSKLRDWLVIIFWLVLGALSGQFIIVPVSGDVRQNRRMVVDWFSIALAWLLFLLCLIGLGILAGFVDPSGWPWRFTAPGWFWNLYQPVSGGL